MLSSLASKVTTLEWDGLGGVDVTGPSEITSGSRMYLCRAYNFVTE